MFPAFRLILLLAVAGFLCQCAHVKTVPPALTATEFTASDGKSMPYARWATEAPPPKAVIICVHGLSGAASDFWPVGERFPKKEIIVYGLQLRGMGNDPDKKEHGNIARGELWVSDLLAFTQLVCQRHPKLPIIWYGESLGSLIVINAAAALPDGSPLVSGIVLSSPVIGFRQKLPAWKYCLIRSLVAIHPGKRISLESLGDREVKVTGYSTHKQQMEKTAHYVEFFSLRLFRAIDKMVRRSQATASRVRAPLLLLYTPNDVFTSREQIESFYARISAADKSKIFLPNSYHLILHDVDRDQTLIDLENWLKARKFIP